MRIVRLAGLVVAVAALLLPASAAAAAPADLDDFEIASFDAVYSLDRDDSGHATLDVVETIVAVFPDVDQNKGFYRDIPEYYGNVRLHTEVASVTDENGEPVPHFTEYFEDFYSVGLGDDSFVRGEQTYVIRYTQRNTIRYFADADVDEFQWDVNGTGWAQPLGRVSAELRIAPELVPELTGEAFCAAGDYGETACPGGIAREDDAETGEAVFRATAGPFEPFENLTIAVAFAAGTFVEGPTSYPPSAYDDDYGHSAPPPTPWWLQFAIIALGPIGIGLGLIARATHRKDEAAPTPPSDIIVPQYTPPEENIMLAAHIAGKPERAFAAQIVDLAVRKRIRLLDEVDGSGDYVAELVDAEGCDRHEQELLDAMFGRNADPGTRFTLAKSSRKLSTAYEKVRKSVVAAISAGDYSSGTSVRPLSAGLLAGGVATVAASVGALVLSEQYSGSEGSFLVVAATGWGGFQTLSRLSTRRVLTEKGRRLNDHLIGMREYLQLAEKDRYAMLQSVAGAERVRIDPDDPAQLVKLYERLLPWAVLWGVELSWSEVLVATAAQAAQPLGWVSTPDTLTGWRLHSIVSGVQRATPAPPVVARARSSSGFSSGGGGWSSSGGSSFSSFSSGGGFSGGGGGGGGGRGR